MALNARWLGMKAGRGRYDYRLCFVLVCTLCWIAIVTTISRDLSPLLFSNPSTDFDASPCTEFARTRSHKFAQTVEHVKQGIPIAAPYIEDYADFDSREEMEEGHAGDEEETDESENLAVEPDTVRRPMKELDEVNRMTIGTLQPHYAKLLVRYAVNEVDWLSCVNSMRRKLLSSMSSNIHDRLQMEIQEVAIFSMCATSRKYSMNHMPHFSGGRRQFLAYFGERGWLMVNPNDSRNNKTQNTLASAPPVVFISSCLYKLRFHELAQKYELVSTTPLERTNTLKIPFFQAIQRYFDSIDCDYRTFHPESFLVESQKACGELVRVIKSDMQQFREGTMKEESLWFFKDKRESFGTGVTVRTSFDALAALNDCHLPLGKSLFVQRGVPNIVRYQGRITQGRSYLLISNLDPATVWLFMGYFNVAAEDATSDYEQRNDDDLLQVINATHRLGGPSNLNSPSKRAYVTNTRSNQRSKRILLAELLANHSRRELLVAKNNVRKAALIAFSALRPKLGHYKPGFTVFGFDYVVQDDDMSVKVLEMNCNCEFFSSGPHATASLRVAISAHLVRGAMDIAFASKLSPELFRALLQKYYGTGLSAATDDDASSDSEIKYSTPRRSWELLYSEEISPPYSIINKNVEQECP